MAQVSSNEEISIPEVILSFKKYISYINKRQRVIWLSALVMFIIGILYALNIEKEYEATNIIISYTSPSSASGMQSVSRLAGLAGIQLPGSQNEDSRSVSELMIPTILNTYPVATKLGDQKLRFFLKDTTQTGLEYFIKTPPKTFVDYFKEWTIQIPFRIINWVLTVFSEKDDEITPITTKIDNTLVEDLTNNSSTQDSNNDSNLENPAYDHVFVNSTVSYALSQLTSRVLVDVTNNIITITAKMPDPYAAADLAQFATDILMQEVVNFEIKKIQEEVVFLEELYNESENKYYTSFQRYSELQDRLRGVTSSASQVEIARATVERDIASQQLAQITLRLEQAKINLKEDTPTFAILDPVKIPQKPTTSNPVSIVFIFIILGLFIGIGWITISGFYRAMINEG